MNPARPLFVLRAVWRPALGPAFSGPEAQALEYAVRMGSEALWRQWGGSDRSQAKIRRRLELEAAARWRATL